MIRWFKSGVHCNVCQLGELYPYVGDRKVDMKTAVSTLSVACHHMLGRKMTCSDHNKGWSTRASHTVGQQEDVWIQMAVVLLADLSRLCCWHLCSCVSKRRALVQLLLQ